jgi:hypothetical protein
VSRSKGSTPPFAGLILCAHHFEEKMLKIFQKHSFSAVLFAKERKLA